MGRRSQNQHDGAMTLSCYWPFRGQCVQGTRSFVANHLRAGTRFRNMNNAGKIAGNAQTNVHIKSVSPPIRGNTSDELGNSGLLSSCLVTYSPPHPPLVVVIEGRVSEMVRQRSSRYAILPAQVGALAVENPFASRCLCAHRSTPNRVPMSFRRPEINFQGVAAQLPQSRELPECWPVPPTS